MRTERGSLQQTVTAIGIYFIVYTQVLDTSVVNLALYKIAADLHLDAYSAAWIATFFGLGMALAFTISGYINQRYGSLWIFFAASLAFVLFSCLCGSAQHIAQLFLGRFLQGVCSGLVITTSQQLFISTLGFERKNFALAIWGSAISLGPLTGPIVGAWLTDRYGWPWIFYINLPIILICLLTLDYNTSTLKQETAWFNITALVCAALFLLCLQYQIDFGEQLAWYRSPIMRTALVVTLLSALLFPWLNRCRGTPLLDFSLFQNPQYALGTIVLMTGNALIIASLLYFPVWLQRSYGMPIIEAGSVVASSSIISFVLAPFVGRLLPPKHFETATISSLLLLGTAFAWMSSYRLESPVADLIAPRILFGLGTTLFYIPLTALSLSTLPNERLVAANSLSLLLRVVVANIFTGLTFIILHRYQYAAYEQYASNPGHFFILKFSRESYPYLQSILNRSNTDVLKNIFYGSAAVCFGMCAAVVLHKLYRHLSRPLFSSGKVAVK